MRYWRDYPKFLQIILLLLLWFTLFYFSFLVGTFLVTKIYGINPELIFKTNAQSEPGIIAAGLLYQFIRSLFVFLGTAMIFAYLTHPKPLHYLGFYKVIRKQHFLVVLLVMLSFIPVTIEIGYYMKLLPLGPDALANDKKMNEIMEAFIQMHSFPDLLIRLLVMALLPAAGEELLFRGVIMRFAYNRSRNIHVAVVISAVMFALAHPQVYSFFPILLSGILLGYIYYWTGSMWLNIFAHFIFNGTQIVLLYLGNTHLVEKNVAAMEHYPWYIMIVSVVVLVVSVVWLNKKATPLPANWSNDFKDL